MSKIILHLKAKDAAGSLRGRHLGLYREIRDLCKAHSIPFEIRARDADIRVGTRQVDDGRFDDGNLYIIDDRSVQAQGVLNAGVAYFWEYWHLDAKGTKAFSSIGDQPYVPEAVSPARRDALLRNLKARYCGKRRSKYDQLPQPQDLPKGGLAVFFQGGYPVNAGATTCSDFDMLGEVQAHAGDRPILVKPHPKSSTLEDLARLQEVAQKDGRLVVTGANVHDMLGVSLCTVSINSTVALEGYLYDLPAILFGQADFHHLADRVTGATGFQQALNSALSRDRDFGHYLAWYFLRNCLHLRSGKLEQHLFDRFAAAGFPKSRLIGR